MKIGLHSNQFDQRGSGKSTFDYAYMLQKRGYDVVLISSKDDDNSGLQSLKNNIKYISYEGSAKNPLQVAAVKYNLMQIVEHEKLDFFYMFKYGNDDKVTPDNCKTGIHCVFVMNEPHGDVYAGVSEYLAKKYNKSSFVFPIVYSLPATINLRKLYNIPENFTVLGRHGGKSTFDLQFVHQAVKDILKYRKDIFFIFLSTEKFIDDKRVLFLPWVKDEQDKFNVIHACDAMIHGRSDGEVASVSVGEFSACNKPIITWSGIYQNQRMLNYDTGHLSILGKKAIVYNGYQDLLDILYSIKQEDISNHNWNVYSDRFSEKNILLQFEKVFLK